MKMYKRQTKLHAYSTLDQIGGEEQVVWSGPWYRHKPFWMRQWRLKFHHFCHPVHS